MKTFFSMFLILQLVLTLQVSAQTSNVIYTYDNLNRLTKVTYPNGSVVIYEYDSAGNRVAVKVTGVEFKGDVTPRPNGKRDGTLTIFDWVQVGRFVVGLDKPSNSSESQRADCHPRGTFGDGKLDIFDWVQAGRFVVGLDDMVPAVNPNPQSALLASDEQLNETRPKFAKKSSELHIVRAVSTTFRRGQISELRIELDARGDENALAFSLNFDPRLLQFTEAVSSTADAQLLVASDQVESGWVGIGLALKPGQTFAAGTRNCVVLRFLASPGDGETTTRISFGNLPASPGIASAEAAPLEASFSDATINLIGTFNPSPTLADLLPNTATAGSAGVTLSVKGENFANGSVVHWNGVVRPTRFLSVTQLAVEIPAADLAMAGVANITVTNPAPGGGQSGALSFAIEPAPQLPVATRALRVVSAAGTPGGTVNVPIEMIALGIENALSFTLTFDPAVLRNPKLSLGGDVEGAQLIVNDSQADSGRIGVVLALPIGQRLSSGTRQMLNVSFNVVAQTNANQTAIGLEDQPLLRAIADDTANPLTATWTPGEVVINRAVTTVLAANYDGSILAGEAIVAAFGAKLATAAETAKGLPLPTSLAGTSVKVRDSAGVERLAPLFFASPTQVNFQIPPGTSTGRAELAITAGDGTVSAGKLQVEKVTPGLFTADASGRGLGAAVALRVKADGTQSYEPIVEYSAAQGRLVPRPIDLGATSDQVYLLLFGTGMRQRTALAAVKAKIGGQETQVSYAGEQGGLVGLDQINVLLSRSLAGRGEVEVLLMVDGRPANSVKVYIK